MAIGSGGVSPVEATIGESSRRSRVKILKPGFSYGKYVKVMRTKKVMYRCEFVTDGAGIPKSA